jgi:hypothetical protein
LHLLVDLSTLSSFSWYSQPNHPIILIFL